MITSKLDFTGIAAQKPEGDCDDLWNFKVELSSALSQNPNLKHNRSLEDIVNSFKMPPLSNPSATITVETVVGTFRFLTYRADEVNDLTLEEQLSWVCGEMNALVDTNNQNTNAPVSISANIKPEHILSWNAEADQVRRLSFETGEVAQTV